MCLSPGEDPPRTTSGTLATPEATELLWRIEAETYEEAMATYHLRLGYRPYRPNGPATPCPTCGALIYAEGSGQCWRCG